MTHKQCLDAEFSSVKLIRLLKLRDRNVKYIPEVCSCCDYCDWSDYTSQKIALDPEATFCVFV